MKTVKITSEIADSLADMLAGSRFDNYWDEHEHEEIDAIHDALISLIAKPSGTSITLEIR